MSFRHRREKHASSPAESPVAHAAEKALYVRPASFTDLLPWVEYDPEHSTFLLEDGQSLGVLLELTAAGTEARTGAYMAALRDAVQTALTEALPEVDEGPWILQVYVQDEPSLGEFANALCTYPGEAVRESDYTHAYLEMFREHLSRITKEGGLFEDTAVTGGHWRGQVRRVRAALYRRPTSRTETPYAQALEALEDVVSKFTATLESASGHLASTEAEMTRLTLGLEGTWALMLEEGTWGNAATLTPRLGLGVRHDSGDAETGHGVDFSGGIELVAPAHGLMASLSGRGVLSHEASGLRDRGIAGTLAWNPQASGRGPTLALSQSFGSGVSGGQHALLAHETLEDLAVNDEDLDRRRLEVHFGYGLPVSGGQFTGIPQARLGFSETGRDYALGWRLVREAGGPGSLDLTLEALRHEHEDQDVPEHGITLKFSARY